MKKKPVFSKENVSCVFDGKFVRVFDLQYEKGKHYYDATRRDIDHLVALKGDDDFCSMEPDAVSCIVVAEIDGEEKLLLTYEYRYPTDQFLLSIPAGLIDVEDKGKEDALIVTAIRELKEETGVTFREGDIAEIANPCLFSTPGMSDESNALVYLKVHLDDANVFTDRNSEGTELFAGYRLVNKEEAKQILKQGKDEHGRFFSTYTYCALSYFLLH